MMKLLRLGVLGGTFDPIHEGHLRLAREARKRAGLDAVLILPMARPGHREAYADIRHRLKMCELALAGEDGLYLSDAGTSPSARYTSDTIGPLHRQYPGAELSLIMGADKLTSLPYWHEAKRLFTQCDFLCFPRPDLFPEEDLQRALAAGARVRMMPSACYPCSSTAVRMRAARFEDTPEVPLAVQCYMAENGLYQEDFLPRLRNMMNPRRFRHTLGVRKEAVRLAALHGVPIQKAALAGVLHDCAKGMAVQEMIQLAQVNQLVRDPDLMNSAAILHGPVGAYVAQNQFGVTDEAVLDAIRSHTIGRPGMTPLEMTVFVADATEENREDYFGLSEIRRLADLSLPAATLKSLLLTQKYLEENRKPFFPAAKQTAEYLEKALTPQERAWMRDASA